MESSSSGVDESGSSLQDVYNQLLQKERDLLLAAQLGKALLEKNEELGLQNEKMAEDYSRQLEVSIYICCVSVNTFYFKSLIGALTSPRVDRGSRTECGHSRQLHY